ncbi:Do family serine endopeptidase [Vitiosangium sp. GDMCC 1.1324]|uniref:Do family serine endopeptidase n=1 Tax=Vitiosangium sp. (strain GDMCC 1.1324) TaxID=2138576 RepID=UPI000D38BD0F|nr:Do family serine endopeptidase [Vitiosangium sp. GDMCC 1.1324]PTL81293.1 peptidase S1 [Vitiosangium sp. GDMCC 1.1324]
MKHARSVFLQQIVLLNVLVLGAVTGCEARTREQGQTQQREAPAPAGEGKQAQQGTGGGGPQQPQVQPQQTPPPQAAVGGSGPPMSVADLVDAVKDSVVNVDVQARAPSMEGMPSDLFERFFGVPGDQGGGGPEAHERIQQGEGSGFIIDPNGLVLTNNHVVANAIDIRVRLNDGREFDAKVLGRDPLTDLALIKLQGNAKNLPVARLGNSDDIRVGDGVVAIGNPFGLTSSVSAGILSARARDIQSGPYDNFLQTDAAINPGNSGGPLFNMRGEVIGINTAIVGGGTGIGFAVPSNMAKTLLPQLEKGQIHRGWLGVSVQDLTPELAQALKVSVHKGAIVTGVQPDTPSAKAGLKQDDVITAINGAPVESSRSLTRDIGFRPPGETVKLTVSREGKQLEIPVKLGERPDLEGLSSAPQGGKEEDTGRKLGLRLQDVDPRLAPGVKQGAMIVDVEPGSPADHAGLQPGMVIVEAGGKQVRNPREFADVVRGQKSGAVLLLRIQLGDNRLLRALTIPEGK